MDKAYRFVGEEDILVEDLDDELDLMKLQPLVILSIFVIIWLTPLLLLLLE